MPQRNPAIAVLSGRPLPCVAAFVFLALSYGVANAGATFFGLGGLDPHVPSSIATAVSADGRTVVGLTDTEGSAAEIAFRWTLAEGMVDISEVSGGGAFVRPYSVSDNGQVIVGRGVDSQYRNLAIVWRQESGATVLQASSNGFRPTAVTGVSADGSVLAGGGVRADVPDVGEAFRWTESTGAVPLGQVDDNVFGDNATDISGDGTRVIGNSVVGAPSGTTAFDWSENAGLVPLGFPGNSTATAISPNGDFVVGSASGIGPFLLSPSGDVVSLGLIGPLGVSDDGARVVGRISGDGDESSAVMWEDGSEARLLQDILEQDYGLDLNGWHLRSAVDISADGNVIVGHGLNPSGVDEAFVAIIPEPAAWCLFAVVMIFVMGYSTFKSSGFAVGSIVMPSGFPI